MWPFKKGGSTNSPKTSSKQKSKKETKNEEASNQQAALKKLVEDDAATNSNGKDNATAQKDGQVTTLKVVNQKPERPAPPTNIKRTASAASSKKPDRPIPPDNIKRSASTSSADKTETFEEKFVEIDISATEKTTTNDDADSTLPKEETKQNGANGQKEPGDVNIDEKSSNTDIEVKEDGLGTDEMQNENDGENEDENKMNSSKQQAKKTDTTKADNGQKRTLLSDGSDYKEVLQTYHRYVNQLAPQRDWMKYKFGLRIRDLLDAKKNIKVLSIGSGSGEVDIDFLNEIVRCGKERLGDTGYNVVYQVVEPNPANIDFFRNTVKENAAYKQIKFKWYQGTYEKFCADFTKTKESDGNKFDFVHFVRVFYHIDSSKAFDKTYSCLLAKNGIMCAVGEHEEAFWPKMMHFLAKYKMAHECFSCSGPVSQNYFLPGWIRQAREKNWRYESYVQGYHFNVTPMYDHASKEGRQLVDFAFHAKGARNVVKKDVLDEFFKVLDANKVEHDLKLNGILQGKQLLFPCEMGAIMITKE